MEPIEARERADGGSWDLDLSREPGRLELRVLPKSSDSYRVRFGPMLPEGSRVKEARIDGKKLADFRDAVEMPAGAPSRFELRYEGGPEVELPPTEVPVGSETQSLKLISSKSAPRSITFVLEGRGGRDYPLVLHHASRGARRETVRFEGPGYQRKEVRFTW